MEAGSFRFERERELSNGRFPRQHTCPMREHPEMVGESIVQGFLIASIILCTFGSVVSVYV
jgi:hypothetical protein